MARHLPVFDAAMHRRRCCGCCLQIVVPALLTPTATQQQQTCSYPRQRTPQQSRHPSRHKSQCQRPDQNRHRSRRGSSNQLSDIQKAMFCSTAMHDGSVRVIVVTNHDNALAGGFAEHPTLRVEQRHGVAVKSFNQRIIAGRYGRVAGTLELPAHAGLHPARRPGED